MAIDKHGSRPEWQGFGSNEWVAQNYTAKEWDLKANGGRGGPVPKTALRDEGENVRKYRNNYDKIDWSKNGSHQSGPVQVAESLDPVGEPAAGDRPGGQVPGVCHR